VDESEAIKIRIERNISSLNQNLVPFYYSNAGDKSKRTITDGNGIILDDFMSTQSFAGKPGAPYKGRALVANNIVTGNGGSGIHAFLSRNVSILHNWAEDNNRTPSQRDGQIFANSSENVLIAGNVLLAAAGKPVTSNYNNKTGVVMRDNLFWSSDNVAPPVSAFDKTNIRKSPGARLTIPGLERLVRAKPAMSLTRTSPLIGGVGRSDILLADFFGKKRPSKATIGPIEP
jgi:hypothetical protein